MDVGEVFGFEEFVDGLGGDGAEAEDGAEGVGARAEVELFAEEFEGVAFFLEWVGVGGGWSDEGEFGYV